MQVSATGICVWPLALGLIATITACDRVPPVRAHVDPPTAAQVEAIVRDRLHANGEFLMVRDPLLDQTTLVSPTAPWAAQCGWLGLKISIRSPASEELLEVDIHGDAVPAALCPELTLAAARAVTAVLRQVGQALDVRGLKSVE